MDDTTTSFRPLRPLVPGMLDMIRKTKIDKSKRPRTVGRSCRFPNGDNFSFMRAAYETTG